MFMYVCMEVYEKISELFIVCYSSYGRTEVLAKQIWTLLQTKQLHT